MLFIQTRVARMLHLIFKCTTLSRLVERDGISAREEHRDYTRATIDYVPPGDFVEMRTFDI